MNYNNMIEENKNKFANIIKLMNEIKYCNNNKKLKIIMTIFKNRKFPKKI